MSQKDWKTQYQHKIVNTCYRFVHNKEDAEDIAQEVFIEIYKSVMKFRKEAKLSTWIYRITVNASLMKIRSKNKDKGLVSLEEYYPKFDEDGHHAIPIIDWSKRPEDFLLNKELKGKIEDAIDKLSEDYRITFIMKDIEGLSNDEISTILEISIPAVKSRVHRSRLFLRDELSSYLRQEHRK